MHARMCALLPPFTTYTHTCTLQAWSQINLQLSVLHNSCMWVYVYMWLAYPSTHYHNNYTCTSCRVYVVHSVQWHAIYYINTYVIAMSCIINRGSEGLVQSMKVVLPLDAAQLLLVPCQWSWQQKQIHLCTLTRTGLKNMSINTFVGSWDRSDRAPAIKKPMNSSVCRLIIPNASRGIPICAKALKVCTIIRKRPNLISAFFESLCFLIVLRLM